MDKRIVIDICAVLFICLGTFSTPAVNALPFHVVDDSGREIAVIYPISRGKTQYISPEDLFAILDSDGQQQYIPITQQLTLNVKGKRFDLEITQPSVSIDREETYVLPYPPVLIEHEPMIPIEFVTELASRLFGFQARLNVAAQRLQILGKDKSDRNEREDLTEDTGAFLLVIDPGHGGADTGVKSRNGLIEKELTLQLAKQLETICRANQIKVKLTRSSDKRLSPQRRADIANKNGGDLFISLHFNASFSPKPNGFRIYVNKPLSTPSKELQYQTPQLENELKIKKFSQSEFLAQSHNVAQLVAEALQSIKLTGTMTDVPLATLHRVYMPAILIELGYLSNLSDEANFSDPDLIDAVAKALFSVVQNFNQPK